MSESVEESAGTATHHASESASDKFSEQVSEQATRQVPQHGKPQASESQTTLAELRESPQQGEMPFAVVLGQAVTELPQDLYIPPRALEVFLEAFEGPLDLLLYLIRRQNLDILDIPIAEITRQYMAYIALLEEMQFELAAEYLVMAAILAEIKSRMLLPKPAGDEEDQEDPREEIALPEHVPSQRGLDEAHVEAEFEFMAHGGASIAGAEPLPPLVHSGGETQAALRSAFAIATYTPCRRRSNSAARSGASAR